jgi:hypothetical protein
VISELVITNVCVAAAAILAPLKVTCPKRLLHTRGDAPAATTVGATLIPPPVSCNASTVAADVVIVSPTPVPAAVLITKPVVAPDVVTVSL